MLLRVSSQLSLKAFDVPTRLKKRLSIPPITRQRRKLKSKFLPIEALSVLTCRLRGLL